MRTYNFGIVLYDIYVNYHVMGIFGVCILTLSIVLGLHCHICFGILLLFRYTLSHVVFITTFI